MATTLTVENWALTELTLDFANQYVPDILIGNANDMNGRGIDAYFTLNGEAASMTGMSVYLAWSHENGNQDLTKFTAVSSKTGHFRVYYPAGMMHEGVALARIEVVVNSKTVTGSRNFQICVERSPIDEDAELDEESWTVLKQLIAEVSAQIEKIELDEEARVTAEETRVSNENQRIANEKARQSAETERVAAEQSRVAAEEKREEATASAIEDVNTKTASAIEDVNTKTASAIEDVNTKTASAIEDVNTKTASAIEDVNTAKAATEQATTDANEAADKANTAYKSFYGLFDQTYEGRDLEVVYADEIANYSDEAAWFNARIIAGNFDGICIMDYFIITLTSGVQFTYRVGAIDPYLYAGDTEITKHHIMMVPDEVWDDSVLWNKTSTNNGTSSNNFPYTASNLHSWETGTFLALLPTKWKNVIAEHAALLEKRYSSSGTQSKPTGWNWTSLGKIWSLSETEVYGFTAWSGYDSGYSKGHDCQFPIFKYTQNRIKRNHSGDRCTWWLRTPDGGSSVNVCTVHAIGKADYGGATLTGVRPLPCFRVGV